MGPVMVLPTKARSQPIPEEEVPLVLHKISRPSLYGSQWRSGMKRIRKSIALFFNSQVHPFGQLYIAPKTVNLLEPKQKLQSQTTPDDEEEEQSSESEVDSEGTL